MDTQAESESKRVIVQRRSRQNSERAEKEKVWEGINTTTDTLVLGGKDLNPEAKSLCDTDAGEVYRQKVYLQQRAFCKRLSFMAVR